VVGNVDDSERALVRDLLVPLIMIVTVAVMTILALDVARSRIMSRDRIWMDASSLSAMVCQHQPTNQTNQPTQPNQTNQPTQLTSQINTPTNRYPRERDAGSFLLLRGQRWLVLFFVPSSLSSSLLGWLLCCCRISLSRVDHHLVVDEVESCS